MGASAIGLLPSQQSAAEKQSNLQAPSHMLKQLCQVSQSHSFAPNPTSLFGSTTNCVINVNFDSLQLLFGFMARKMLTEEMDKALSSMDFNF